MLNSGFKLLRKMGAFALAAWLPCMAMAAGFGDRITVGVANEPPYTIYEAGKPVTGAEPDILRRIATDMGVKEIDAKVLEFGAMIPSLQSRRIDVIATGLYINPARCKVVAFSEPDLCTSEGFVVLKHNPKNIHSFKGIADDKSIRYGVCGGCSAERRALEEGVARDRITIAPDHQSGIKMLLDGRIDVYSAPDLALRDAVAKMSKDAEVEVVAAAGEKPVCAAVAFRMDQKDVRDEFDAHLAKLKVSGEYDRIVSKYGFDPGLVKGATRADYCGGAK